MLARIARPASWLLSRPAVFLPLLLLLCLGVSAQYVDSRLPTPDEGAMLTAAVKIQRGDVFYRDIDAYPFPGSHYLLAISMHFFGDRLSVARWMAVALYCAIVASLYATAAQLMDRRWAALFGLSLLSFKFLAWPAFSIYIYSDVAFCASCIAVAALVGHRFQGASLRLLIAGVAIGGAVASKQNLGIYLGAACASSLLFPRLMLGIPGGPLRRRCAELATLGLGVAAAFAPMLIYFSRHQLLGEMLYSGLIRPFTRYLPTSGISFSTPLAWWRFGDLVGVTASPYFVSDYWHMLQQQQLPGEAWYPAYWFAGELASRLLYTSIPVAFGWGALRRFRSRAAQDEQGARRSFFTWLALAAFLSALPRADSFHVLSVYPMVALLIFTLAAGTSERPAGPRRLRLAAGAVALLLVISGGLAWNRLSQLTHRVHLERAEVWVEPSEAWIEPLVEYVSREVLPTEKIFVYGHEAQFYFLTGRFYPWPYSQLYPGQEGEDLGTKLIFRLAFEPPKLVLRGVLTWPGVPDLVDYAPELENYIVWHFGSDEDFFVEHPIPGGGPPPPSWTVSVMHRLPPEQTPR